jgi:hypothetical protein
MLTDYTQGSRPEPRCRHRWSFHCWAGDPFTQRVWSQGRGGTYEYLIEVCTRCRRARLTLYEGRQKPLGADYAGSVEHAMLGEPVPVLRAEKVAVN